MRFSQLFRSPDAATRLAATRTARRKRLVRLADDDAPEVQRAAHEQLVQRFPEEAARLLREGHRIAAEVAPLLLATCTNYRTAASYFRALAGSHPDEGLELWRHWRSSFRFDYEDDEAKEHDPLRPGAMFPGPLAAPPSEVRGTWVFQWVERSQRVMREMDEEELWYDAHTASSRSRSRGLCETRTVREFEITLRR